MRRYTVEVNGKEYLIDVQELAADRFQVRLNGQDYEVRMTADEDVASAHITPEILPLRVEGEEIQGAPRRSSALRAPAPDLLPPLPSSRPLGLPPQPNLPGDSFRAELIAPMPGTILSVAVAVGDRVARGQTVLVLEAMKMKNAIKSPQAAVVAEVLVQPGQAVGYGYVMLKFQQVS
jgi:biotin carboxyl carrier protein